MFQRMLLEVSPNFLDIISTGTEKGKQQGAMKKNFKLN